jgi:hypothetical protein
MLAHKFNDLPYFHMILTVQRNCTVCSVGLHSMRHSNQISGFHGRLLPGKYKFQDGKLINRSSGNECVCSAVNGSAVVSLAGIFCVMSCCLWFFFCNYVTL